MNEEEEFGMSKMSRDADPMEQENKSAVKDHPDFNFLSADEIRAAVASDDKRAVPLWMTCLPVEKDPSQWTILEVQIRPDRSWDIIKELIATVCISKGLLVAEEHANRVLFRKKVTQESAHGMTNTATFLYVYVLIGVSPSKLRVVDICTLVADENKLLGGMMPTGSSLWNTQDHNQHHEYALDQLLAAVQSTLLSQCLSLSHLYMSSPEDSMDSSMLLSYRAGVENAELDEGYVADLKRVFSSEMKANMRDLCIPLESYAYDQEFACALLIGLLEPTLKKYTIKLTGKPTSDGCVKDDTGIPIASVKAISIKEDNVAVKEEAKPAVPSPSATQATSIKADKIYGEVVSEMVQNLWRVCKEDCDVRLRAKIEEKQQQVTARVEAVQGLRVRAIRAIMEVEGAQVSSLHQPADSDRKSNVLLYEASCMINGIPVTLHVTYGNLIYRTMVPVFAHTTVVPFEDIVGVKQTTSFGIQVVSVELDSTKYVKGITIAMGLEVDLLYQLLLELFSMHQREIKANIAALPPLQQQETEKNPGELQKILGPDEEETKEEEPSATKSTSSSDATDGSAAADASSE